MAQSLLLCADEAEDVTHDLLERLWTERGRLDGCRDIASFVMAAVRNRCYDCLRLRRADGRRNNAVAGWAERATTGDAEGWEARDLVRRAMAELPGRQREVLYLKDIEGYPTREIAGMVACDEAQVRVILSRARNALRGILKKMWTMKERKERIEKLLERYFEARTTDAEEQERRLISGRGKRTRFALCPGDVLRHGRTCRGMPARAGAGLRA